MIEQVKEKMTEAFHHFNKKDGVNINDVRIKAIVGWGGKVSYALMNRDEKVRSVEFNEVVNLGMLFQSMAKNKFDAAINKVISENKLPQMSASVIILPAQDISPLVHLYNGGVKIKDVEIENLIIIN